MPSKINLLGQHFGKLIVLEETNQRKNKSVVWKCQCECGNIAYYSTKNLRSDGIISCSECGNKRAPQVNLREDIIGKKFNHLTVIEITKQHSGGKLLYKCECDCLEKNIVYATSTDLKNNHTKSCGCIARKYQINDIINNRLIVDYIGATKPGRYYYKCKCLFCNRIYSSLGQTLEHSHSCGCQRSLGEYNIIQLLEENNIPYIKEYNFPNSLFRYDFAILNDKHEVIRLIEFDGEQHYLQNVNNLGWNTLEKFNYTYENDRKKNLLACKYHIPLVRIPYWEKNKLTLETLLKDKYLIYDLDKD